MSEQETCPKCGAGRRPGEWHPVKVVYTCGSRNGLSDEDLYVETDICLRRQLAQAKAALRLILDECRILNRGTPEMEKIERVALAGINAAKGAPEEMDDG